MYSPHDSLTPMLGCLAFVTVLSGIACVALTMALLRNWRRR